MYPIRGPKFLMRIGWCLVFAAPCVITCILATSNLSARPAFRPDATLPTAAEAARFLKQSTWGPTTDLIAHVETVGFEQFLDEQFTAPISSYPTLSLVPTTPPEDCPAMTVCRRDNYTLYPVQTRFFTNALYGEDQLRQRVAFALQQIFVVSGVDI